MDCPLKRCKGACGREKPLDDFHKNNAAADGHHRECKTCAKASSKRRHHANPEAQKARAHRWYLKNVDKVKAKADAWRKKHPERAAAHKLTSFRRAQDKLAVAVQQEGKATP